MNRRGSLDGGSTMERLTSAKSQEHGNSALKTPPRDLSNKALVSTGESVGRSEFVPHLDVASQVYLLVDAITGQPILPLQPHGTVANDKRQHEVCPDKQRYLLQLYQKKLKGFYSHQVWNHQLNSMFFNMPHIDNQSSYGIRFQSCSYPAVLLF